MTRSEIIEGMVGAGLVAEFGETIAQRMATPDDPFRRRHRKIAEAALSALEPILRDVVGALEPFATDLRNWQPGASDETMIGAHVDMTDLSVGDLRSASSSLAQLKEIING